jgi:hypothetical protein
LEAFTRKLRGSYTVTSTESGSRTPRSNSKTCTYAANAQFFAVTEISHTKGTERVKVINDDYAFFIGRRADHLSERYAIEWVEPIGADAGTDKQVRYHERQAGAAVFSAWKFFGKSFTEFEQIPGFALKKVSPADGFVRIEFDCHPPDDPQWKEDYLTDVFLVCDPTNYWALREYGATMRGGNLMLHATLEYAAPLNGFPVVKTKREKLGWGAGSPYSSYVNLWTYDFAEPSLDTAPPSEFRLSHYNLPEPNFNAHARWSWALYSAVGVVCLLVAYTLWRRKQVAA